MIVIKEVKKVSQKTLEKFNNFDYEKYEDEMNSEDNREKMKNFFHLVSKHDSETIELSKQMRIR